MNNMVDELIKQEEGMNLRRNEHFVRSLIISIPVVLFAAGCNNPPQYKYQDANSPVATHESKGSATTGDVNPVASAEPQAAPVAPEAVVPTIPELSVGELLQSGKTYDNQKIKVTGKKGKLLPHYKMAYIINSSDESYIPFSYDQMSFDDKGTLSRLNTLQKITVSGVWNASRKVLAGEEIAPSM